MFSWITRKLRKLRLLLSLRLWLRLFKLCDKIVLQVLATLPRTSPEDRQMYRKWDRATMIWEDLSLAIPQAIRFLEETEGKVKMT